MSAARLATARIVVSLPRNAKRDDYREAGRRHCPGIKSMAP